MRKVRKFMAVFILFSMVFGLYLVPINATDAENLLFHYTFTDYAGGRGTDGRPNAPNVLYNEEIKSAGWNRSGMNQDSLLETATVNGRSGLRMKRTGDGSSMYLENTFAGGTSSNTAAGISHTYVAESSILFENVGTGSFNTMAPLMRTQSGSTAANFMRAEGGMFKISSFGEKTEFVTEEEKNYEQNKWYDMILVAKEQKNEQGEMTGVIVSQYVNGKKFFEQHLTEHLREATGFIRFGGINKKDQSLVFTDYKVYTAFNDLELNNEGVTDGADGVSCESIKLKFNNKINTSTLASIVLKDESENQIPIIVESEEITENTYDLKSVIIKPKEGLLDSSTTYTLDLSGVEDLMGGTLASEDAVLSFTTHEEQLKYELDVENDLITASLDTSKENLNGQEDITLIIALYKQDVLIDVAYESRNIFEDPNEGLLESNLDISEFEAGEYEIKLIVWDKLSTMNPFGYDLFKTGVINIHRTLNLTLPEDFATLGFDITRLESGEYTHNATPENQLGDGALNIYISSNSTTDGLGLTESEKISYAQFATNCTEGLYDSYFSTSAKHKFILNVLDEYYSEPTAIKPAELEADILIRSASGSGFTWFGKFAMQNDSSKIVKQWAETEDGIYKTKLADENIQISFPMNFSSVDEFGMPKPYIRVFSLNECITTPGSFYQEVIDGATSNDDATFSRDVYCNPFAGDVIADIELACYLPLAEYPARCESDFGRQKLIFENIGFIAHSAKFQPYSQYDEAALMFFNCKFFRSKAGDNALSIMTTNVGEGSTYTYKVFVFDCIAAYGSYDGFNYHAKGGQNCLAVEINSIAYGNGAYKLGHWFNGKGSQTVATSSNSNNGSTAHDGIKMLRVGGWYWDNEGATVADVETYSISIGCKSGNILDTIASNGFKSGFYFQHSDALGIPKYPKYVIDCHTYGENVEYGVYCGTSAQGYTYYLDCTVEEGIIPVSNRVTPLPSGWNSIISGEWVRNN